MGDQLSKTLNVHRRVFPGGAQMMTIIVDGSKKWYKVGSQNWYRKSCHLILHRIAVSRPNYKIFLT